MENESERAVIDVLAEVLRIFAARGRTIREQREKDKIIGNGESYNTPIEDTHFEGDTGVVTLPQQEAEARKVE